MREEPPKRTSHGLLMRVLKGCVLVLMGAIPAAGQTLTVATTEYTADWNPVAARSYPAQLMARFTTERLFELRCLGGQDQTRPEFVNVCQVGTGYNSGSIRLMLDPERCAELSSSDVRFTLSQVNKVPHNTYFQHELSLVDDQLSLGKPGDPAEWVAKQAMSFPILKSPGPSAESFFKRQISVGDQEKYNEVARGLFKVAEITDLTLRLARRQKSAKGQVAEIQLTTYDLFRTMRDAMTATETAPDLVLSWPITKPYEAERYRGRRPENLGSFTYVGFNFQTGKSEPFYRLVRSRLFRELFTKSLWVLSPVEANVDFTGQGGGTARGIFLGESFDTGDVDRTDRSPRRRVEQGVIELISDLSLQDPVELQVLLSPGFEWLFDRADRGNIETELNEIWGPEGMTGIRFKLIDPSAGAAGFEAQKEAGHFDLIFETLIYGRNHLTYMAFLQPENELNYLGVQLDALSKGQIDKWMKEGNRGIKSFLDVVAREYPVAVIGQFPRRDLFHHSLEIPEPCGEGAVAVPYQSLGEWRKTAVAPVSP